MTLEIKTARKDFALHRPDKKNIDDQFRQFRNTVSVLMSALPLGLLSLKQSTCSLAKIGLPAQSAEHLPQNACRKADQNVH